MIKPPSFDDQEPEPVRNPSCEACGLYQFAKSYRIAPEFDPRDEKEYPGIDSRAPILVIGSHPGAQEDAKGRNFCNARGGGEFLRAFLNSLETRWILTNAANCYPGRDEKEDKEKKPTPKQANLCTSTFINPLIDEYKPRVIVCLGAVAAKAVLGKACPRTINSCRAPIPVPGREDCWAIITSHPLPHGLGKADYTEEYFRVFSLAETVTVFGYKQQTLDYHVVRSIVEAEDIVRRKMSTINSFSLDIETAVTNNHPARMSVWHPESEFLCLSITWKTKDKYETYVFPKECVNASILSAMISNRIVSGHNIKYEIQGLWRYFGIDLFVLAKEINDTLVKLYLPNQDNIGNGLKPFAQRTFFADEWDRFVWSEVDEENLRISLQNKEIGVENRRKMGLLKKALRGETTYPVKVPNPKRPGYNMTVQVLIPPVSELVPDPKLFSNSADFRHVNPETLYCVSPDTLVLTTDLRWVRADAIKQSDSLIGFEEYPSEKGGRRLRTSVVESVKTKKSLRYRITTDKGSIVVSDNHRFLLRKGKGKEQCFVWEEAHRLKPDSIIGFFGNTWEEDTSFEAGYLSGIMDGEGSLCYRDQPNSKVKYSTLSIAQNPGIVSDRIGEILLSREDLSFVHREPPAGERKTIQWTITNLSSVLRALGTIRPLRLLDKAKTLEIWNDKRIPYGNRDAKVLSVEELPVGKVVSIQTSTKTLITNGFLSHNCYNGWDTYYTEKIVQEALPNEVPPHPVAWEHLRRAIWSLCRTERTGLPVDKDKMERLKVCHNKKFRYLQLMLLRQPEVQAALQSLDTYHENVNKWMRQGFTYRNEILDLIKPKGYKLYEALIKQTVGIAHFPRTEKGKLAGSALVLSELAGIVMEKGKWVSSVPEEERTRHHDIWRMYFFCRKSQDMQAKFLDGLIKYVVEDEVDDVGRIRTSYRITKVEKAARGSGADQDGGAASGRLASSDPNLQNLAKDKLLRSCVRAPKGYKILEFDYDRIEPVCLAFVADCKEWRRIFENKWDIYCYIANQVKKLGIDTNGDPDEVRIALEQIKKTHPELRETAKTCVLAVMYNQGAPAFAAKMKIEVYEAEQFLAGFDKAFPEIGDYKRRIDQLLKDGELVTNLFGRAKAFPLDSYNIDPSAQFRSAINFPIQSLASDIALWKLWEIYEWIDANDLMGIIRPINVVHDAIWFEVKEEEYERLLPLISQLMEDMSTLPFLFDIPLYTTAKVGNDLGNMPEVEFERIAA